MNRSPSFHPAELAVKGPSGESAVAARNAPLGASALAEAARLLLLSVNSWIMRQVPQRMEWDDLDASPFNRSTLEN